MVTNLNLSICEEDALLSSLKNFWELEYKITRYQAASFLSPGGDVFDQAKIFEQFGSPWTRDSSDMLEQPFSHFNRFMSLQQRFSDFD